MTKKVYNSRRYHEFFEGYTERIVSNNGKNHVERIYTGEYYCPVLSLKKRMLRKILYCVTYLLTVIIYVYVATRQMEVNITRWVGICHGFTAFTLLWLLIAVVYYVAAGEKMSVRIYRGASIRLKKLSFAAAVLFGLMSMVYFILTMSGGGSWTDFMKLFPYSAIACGILFLMYFVENKTEYEVIQGNADLSEDGEQIEY